MIFRLSLFWFFCLKILQFQIHYCRFLAVLPWWAALMIIQQRPSGSPVMRTGTKANGSLPASTGLVGPEGPPAALAASTSLKIMARKFESRVFLCTLTTAEISETRSHIWFSKEVEIQIQYLRPETETRPLTRQLPLPVRPLMTSWHWKRLM